MRVGSHSGEAQSSAAPRIGGEHCNKTDRADTKGMLEAHRNEAIRPVAVKTVAQQALCSLHRIRAGWIAERTARINTLRGLLREFGIIIPVGAQHAVPNAGLHIEDAESEIPDSLRPALAEICTEIRELERRIKMIEIQLAALAAQTPVVARLMTIPGIGLIVATALVAFTGDIHRFPSARHFASYLGLTPKEYSTGSRRRLATRSILHTSRPDLCWRRKRCTNWSIAAAWPTPTMRGARRGRPCCAAAPVTPTGPPACGR